MVVFSNKPVIPRLNKTWEQIHVGKDIFAFLSGKKTRGNCSVCTPKTGIHGHYLQNSLRAPWSNLDQKLTRPGKCHENNDAIVKKHHFHCGHGSKHGICAGFPCLGKSLTMTNGNSVSKFHHWHSTLIIWARKYRLGPQLAAN